MLLVQTLDDVERYLEAVRTAAVRARQWIVNYPGEGLTLLRAMKFEHVGFHPIEGRPLNLIEQVNQTWTYTAALAAARQLLELHQAAGGFRLAPGAHAELPLDII